MEDLEGAGVTFTEPPWFWAPLRGVTFAGLVYVFCFVLGCVDCFTVPDPGALYSWLDFGRVYTGEL